MARDDDTGSSTTTDTREQGVEFGDLSEELESAEYPMTQDELLANYGNSELETAGGSETLEEILGEQEETAQETAEEQTYESADDVHQTILNMIGSEAVGRPDYSDRGGDLPDDSSEGEDQTDESL